MRWVNMLIIGLAPLLSCADAVDGAPAGALKAGNTSPHRRALVDAPGSPWHRRYADARRQLPDPNNPDPTDGTPVGNGPPAVITVPTDTASTSTSSSDTTTPTDTSSSSSSSSSDDSSSTSSTPTDTSSSDSSTPTDTSSSDSSTSTDTSSSDSSTSADTASNDGSTPTDTSSSTSSTPTDTASSTDDTTLPTSTDTTTPDTTTSTDTSTSTSTDTSTSDPSTSTTSTDDGGIDITIGITITLPDPLSTSSTSTPTDTPADVPTTDTTAPSTTLSDPLDITTSIDIPLPTISISDNSTTTDTSIISITLPPIIIDPSNTTSTDPPITTPDSPNTTPTDLPITTPTDPPITTPTDPTDGPISTPTPTSISSSTIVILSLPGELFPNVTSASIGDVTTDTDDATTTKPPITIESQYQFITATSFLIAPTTSTSSASVTNTDPDAVLTSATLQSAGPSATVTSAAIPSSIPMFITPPASSDHVPPGTTLDGYTEISILFQSTAGWMWILQSSETAAQILAYMPPILYTSLNCEQTDVKTIGLSAFEPADTTSPNDLMTMWVGLIKTDLVSTLSAMIHTPTSEFYNTGDPLAQAIAKNVVAAYNIATINGVSNQDGAPTTDSGTTVVDNSRRNAIIGVSTAFGAIALVVFAWWVMKTYRARQEGIHKRLSYGNEPNYGAAGAGIASGGLGYGGGVGGGYGAGGARADSPPMLHNPFLTEREREDEARGIRRNSFYAIGPDDASIEEETFDYMSQHSGGGGVSSLNRAGSNGSGGGRWVPNSGGLTVPGAGGHVGNAGGHVRRPILGQQISQPILRESSMGNW